MKTFNLKLTDSNGAYLNRVLERCEGIREALRLTESLIRELGVEVTGIELTQAA